MTPEEAFGILHDAATSEVSPYSITEINKAANTLVAFVNALDPAARRAALARAAYDSQVSRPARNIPDPANDVIDEHDQHLRQANT